MTEIVGRKVDAVLRGATEVFEEHGFDRASMDMVVGAAGVSKATLYKYYPTKADLFRAIVERQCACHAERLRSIPIDGKDARDVLMHVALGIGRVFSSQALLRLFRMTISRSDEFPDIGRSFYAAGPGTAIERIAHVMKALAERGELDIDDPVTAAVHFKALCKEEIFQPFIFDVKSDFSDQELEQIADRAVTMFMRAYGQKS